LNPSFIDIQQGSDDWLDKRAGKLTGSAIGDIMANYGKAFGNPAHKLAVKLAIEQITGKPIPSEYTNAHMERGHEQEPIARALYEKSYFCEVANGGFFDNGKTGSSPDGRVIDENGIIEIKSVIYSVHYDNIKRRSFDPNYKWQYLFNLRETGADWIDTISFCADFPDDSKLYVYRIHAKAVLEGLSMINTREQEFFTLIEEKKNTISSRQG
jgi:hypothetical protein